MKLKNKMQKSSNQFLINQIDTDKMLVFKVVRIRGKYFVKGSLAKKEFSNIVDAYKYIQDSLELGIKYDKK